MTYNDRIIPGYEKSDCIALMRIFKLDLRKKKSVYFLANRYMAVNEIFSAQNVRHNNELIEFLFDLQDTILSLLLRQPCKTLRDVAAKIEIWRLDNDDVESVVTTRGEKLVLQALSDLNNFVEEKQN